MENLFSKLSSNTLDLFKGKNLVLQVLAIAATYLLVVSGADWAWYKFFSQSYIYPFFFPGAGIVGFVLPVAVPLCMLAIGRLRKNERLQNNAFALGQAIILAWIISSTYKVFTGRPGPEMGEYVSLTDISRVFKFGFFRGGAFWGWPSSHTTVAFAFASTVSVLYRQNKKVLIGAWVFALYVGFGAGISFHWFSDFLAGAIIGAMIGTVVGKAFYKE